MAEEVQKIRDELKASEIHILLHVYSISTSIK